MGINAKVRKHPKAGDVITAEALLEGDIRSCMRCRFFHNSRQRIASKCVKMSGNPPAAEIGRESQCFGCPYNQAEKHCFPCMKKLLEGTEGKST